MKRKPIDKNKLLNLIVEWIDNYRKERSLQRLDFKIEVPYRDLISEEFIKSMAIHLLTYLFVEVVEGKDFIKIINTITNNTLVSIPIYEEVEENITPNDIKELGWTEIEDRGMSENGGNYFIMYKNSCENYKLRFWRSKHDFQRGQRIEITGHLLNANFYLVSKDELKLIMEQLEIIPTNHGK